MANTRSPEGFEGPRQNTSDILLGLGIMAAGAYLGLKTGIASGVLTYGGMISIGVDGVGAKILISGLENDSDRN